MINKILYRSVGLGGTFDHFHDGHKDFIRFAASFSKELVIGVTNKKMTLSKPFNKTIESAHARSKAVENFCEKENIKAKIIYLNDLFGPTIEKKTVDAIACTSDTVKGANKINEIRSKLRMRELPVHVHDLLLDKNNHLPISSSRIRQGQINRDGEIFLDLLKTTVKLSEKQRAFFSKIQGKIIIKPSKSEYFTAVVGDSSLEKFIANNWSYDLGIFDGKQQREVFNSKILKKLSIDKTVTNPSGTISQDFSQLLTDWDRSKKIKNVFIEGEEDLTAVAIALLFPLGSTAYYGQPNQGIVEMKITEGLKYKFSQALKN